MPDREIVCCDCKATFTWSEGEQAYYQEKGLHEPKRCPKCRQARKARHNDGRPDEAQGQRQPQTRSACDSSSREYAPERVRASRR